VGTLQNKIHVIGGGLDYSENAFENFSKCVQEQAKAELQEEVEAHSKSNDAGLRFMYTLFDEETNYLSIRFVFQGKIIKPRNNEFTKLTIIPADQIDEFIDKYRDRIAPTALTTLELLKVPSLAAKFTKQ